MNQLLSRKKTKKPRGFSKTSIRKMIGRCRGIQRIDLNLIKKNPNRHPSVTWKHSDLTTDFCPKIFPHTHHKVPDSFLPFRTFCIIIVDFLSIYARIRYQYESEWWLLQAAGVMIMSLLTYLTYCCLQQNSVA